MKIYAFYSFKGGVGRTALLTNLAAYWASHGKVVGLVEMDLAAPGLSYLLNPQDLEKGKGFSELLAAYHQGQAEKEGHFGYILTQDLFVPLKEVNDPAGWGKDGRILILPAGKTHFYHPAILTGEQPLGPSAEGGQTGAEDTSTLRAFSLIFREDLSRFRLPDQPERGFDAVFIDCRTGFPELEDLTLGYLADKMVVVSGLNVQNQEGLKETLDNLAKKRIKPGQTSALLTVVFSPTSPHLFDLPAEQERLKEGEKMVESFCRSRDEISPRIFTLPYTPKLLVQDRPFVHQADKRHPYRQAVLAISEHLLGESLEMELAKLPEKHAASDETGDSPRKRLPLKKKPSVEEKRGEAFLADIVNLPPWHWPLTMDPKKSVDPEKRMEALFQGAWKHKPEAAERFLNAVAGSISLNKHGKISILQEQHQWSAFQLDEFLKNFDAEQQKFSAMSHEDAEDILELYFESQQVWVEIVTPLAWEGRHRFFHWPLSEEIPHPFPAWEKRDTYWWLLSEGLRQEPGGQHGALQAIRKAVAMQNSPEKTVTKLLDLMEAQPSGWNNRLWQLARDVAQGDDWLTFLVLEKAEPKPTPDIIQKILQPFIQTPPESWDKLLDLAYWIRSEQPVLNHHAEVFLRLAIEKKPDNAFVYVALGNFLSEDTISRFAEAEAAYRKAISLDSTDFFAWLSLGVLLKAHLGRSQEAGEAWLRAFAMRKRDPAVCYYLGRLYQYDFKNYTKAMDCYRIGLSSEQESPSLLMSYGHFLLILGEKEAARRELTHSLAAFSKQVDYAAFIHCIMLAVGLGPMRERVPPLLRELETFMLHYPHDHHLHSAKAILMLEQGEAWQRDWEAAIPLLVNHSQWFDSVFFCYYLSGLRPDLRETLREMARILFNLPETVLRSLKGAPTPQEKWDRFRPFVEGRSDGAGDPRDLSLFCLDAEAVLQEIRGDIFV